MKIAIGSDHAGFRYKERLEAELRALGHELTDFGTHSIEPVDYPPVIRRVAHAVAAGRFERGIVLGGSGNGEAMAANRVPGVRCALCWNVESARLARQHNDSNVLSLGERLVAEDALMPIVTVWLTTAFEGGRHARRVALMDPPALGLVTLVVRDYDEALHFFVDVLGFEVKEDTPLGGGKRWVVVHPPGSAGAGLLLARAATPAQTDAVGNQAGGRVFLFLRTDDFRRDYDAFRARGVHFVEEPREESYGRVAVFEDLYGNRWDLVQRPAAPDR